MLFLVANLESGIGVTLLRTLRHLPGHYEAVVCEFTSDATANKDAARRLGAHVVQLGKRGTEPAILRDVLRVARAARPDVVQGFELETNFYAGVAGRVVRAPSVASFHGMVSAFRRSRSPFLYAALQLAARIVCVSRPIAARCRAHAPWLARRITVIPNGVDVPSGPPPHGGRRRRPATVTYVGNFHSPVKGHEHLIRALRLLRPSEARLWLVGSGTFLPDMRKLASKLGVADRVTFWGTRDDVPELLAQSDVFVLPSLSEGCPSALLEAMSAGVPVVATAVDGVREIVADGATGLLVAPGDPCAIADALRALAHGPELGATLAANAREHVTAAFSAETVARRYETLYAELAGRS